MAATTYRILTDSAGRLRAKFWGSAATLDAASADIPNGGYTTLRTYGKRGVIVPALHFDRLEESARLLGHPVRVERDTLRRLLCDVLDEVPWEESRLRITVDCTVAPGELWLSVEPLKIPDAALYDHGAACVTRVMQRDNPKAKYTEFINASREERGFVKADVNEVLMVDSGQNILEGLSSNFFAFYHGNLYTADDGVLHGITRTLILDEAVRANIPIRLTAPHMGWLPTLEEAFISSASRAVLPVTRIDDTIIADGQPGAITRLLMARYERRLQEEIEAIC